MSYSSFPLANIDTINDHTGFYFATGYIIFILVICCIKNDWDDPESVFQFGLASIVGAIIISFSAWISWHTGEIVVYKNEPVIARMYDNSVETLAYTERVNKRDVVKYQTSSFVYYEVPEGVVSFQRSGGQVWPKTAILYKN